MKKIKQFMSKNVTWGGYAKMCGICYLISVLCGIGSFVWFKLHQ